MNLDDTPFAMARNVIVREFRHKEPNTVYHSYLANIACKLYDEAHGPSPQLNYRNMEACNEMASRILEMCFGESDYEIALGPKVHVGPAPIFPDCPSTPDSAGCSQSVAGSEGPERPVNKPLM